MNNYTTDLYEMKREIVILSKKLSKGLNKSDSKFVMDMIYGIFKSGSTLTSEIARSLEEKIKLNSTITRICNNLVGLKKEQIDIIKSNYEKTIIKHFNADEIVCDLDDTDISKEYGKKFEDLCTVRDASSVKEKLVNGYHVCEAVILTEEMKQPLSVYSEIYSTESYGFKSKNNYTLESIKKVRELFPDKKHLFTGDRGYDADYIYKEILSKEKDYFITRLTEKRTLLFKGKKQKALEVAKSRKGKIKMNMQFAEEKKDCYVSYTRVQLPKYLDKELTMVIVYGLSEEEPMVLLTNKKIDDKNSAIKIARHYMNRWRIEEYFRAKKQEYDFEDMRVRTLTAMNNLNMFLTLVLGEINLIAESMDKKLLCFKITERSKSLRNKVIVWISQIARGVVEILKYARSGIKEFQNIEIRAKNKQLALF